MLVKIDDGFYLNAQRIVSVRILKHPQQEQFKILVEYHAAGNTLTSYPKWLDCRKQAEAYLQHIHRSLYALSH